MKKTILAVLAVALIFSLGLASCDDGSGNNNNTSLNGVWVNSAGNTAVTVNGSSGVFTSGYATNPLWQDAMQKGYVIIGTEWWKNLTKTNNSTWSGRMIYVSYNPSSPTVATGTDYVNVTITLSANGQTLTVSSSSGGGFIDTYTKNN